MLHRGNTVAIECKTSN